MISKEILQQQIPNNLQGTNFNIGEKYGGKVRDNYIIDNKRILITTDKISAFDRILCTIPFKGQVLNQISTFWFEQTKDICPNHVLEVPDPNAIIGKQCEPIHVEMVIRGFITGVTSTSAWFNYKKGVRNFCGNQLPEGLVKNQKFDKPISTPSTKAEKGAHDVSVGKQHLFDNNIIDEETYNKMEEIAFKLFQRGTEIAAKNNLILVDTKYEFGLHNGEITLIDEIHTPDSSRYWVKDTYEELFAKGEDPDKLDKEYVRQFLAKQGFIGDGDIPNIPDDIKVEAAQRYIKAYEMITGKTFEAQPGNILERIKNNLIKAGFNIT
tara:strand:- start:5790 stop:6761 length:972 start_codon:yes stop_codon:yes gene_type:complete